MRRSVPILGLILAGAVLGWIVAGLLVPSTQQIRETAEAALPEGSVLNRRWENVGHPLVSGAFYAAVEFEMPAGVAVPSAPHDVRGAMRVELTAEDGTGPEGGALGLVRVAVDPVVMRHRQEAGAVLGALGLPILVTAARARRSV